MTPPDLVVSGRRVVLPDGERPAAVVVSDGRIVAVMAPDEAPEARRSVMLADDEVLIPGLVDSHVHLQDPGRDGWEDARHATLAAALGGVTTLVDMPLDCEPVTTDLDALVAKRQALTGRLHVDVGLWGGAVPTGLGRLRELVDAGVLGLKCFLSPTGVEAFPPLTRAELAAALVELRGAGVPLLVHAEDEDLALPLDGDPARYADLLASRPAAVEESAVAAVVAAVERTGGWAHLVHLSSRGSIPLVALHTGPGRLTAETCPHYLVLSADQVRDGDTLVAAAPPVRHAADADALWAALVDGTLDIVVSDHSPCAPGAKAGGFGRAAPGISSLQLRLPVLWTAAQARGIALADVVRWACTGPADLAGLPHKGRISVGADADLCVLAPDERWTVGAVAHQQPGTPYDGWEVTGRVRTTWLRGHPVDPEVPRGRLLARTPQVAG